jgi:hypothetical protein
MLLEDEERATIISLLNDIRQHWNEMVVNTSGITITDNKKENGEGNKVFAIYCYDYYFKDLFACFQQLARIMFNKNLRTVRGFSSGNQSRCYQSLFLTVIFKEAFEFTTVPSTEDNVLKEIADEVFEDMLKTKKEYEVFERFHNHINARLKSEYERLRKDVSDEDRMDLITMFIDQFGFLISDISTINVGERFSTKNGYDERVRETIGELRDYAVSALHN